MGKVGRWGLVVAAALGLAGCETAKVIGNLFGSCDTEAALQVKPADWEKAEVAAIRIRQNHFSPMIVHATKGRPTILRIVNGDDGFHTFRAGEFFANISVAKVVRGTDEDGPGCHGLVTIPAHKTVEIHFVGLNDGRYEFQDDLVPALLSGGAMGIVDVR